jgi:glycosyltransferase involved in cell wall biosynthesis
MRIVELIETLGKGGAERMVSYLALSLSRQGHSVSIVSLRDIECLPIPRKQFDDAGVDIIELGKTDGFSRRALQRLVHYVRSRRFDVIHTHNPQMNHYGVLAARLGSVSVVVNTLHGLSTLDLPRWALLLYRLSSAFTDRIVPVCNAADNALRSRLGIAQSKRAVICNGIEVVALQAVPRRRSEGKVVFGAIGRMVPVKDHRSLLEAFAIVKLRYPQCRLELVGSGELEPELRRQARALGIEADTTLKEPDTDIVSFLAGIDIFVLSSISEGLPLVVLEAMVAGKPIVATAVGGVPELVREANCGWLCAPSSPQDLAMTMMRACDSSDKEEMGARGRRHAVSRYSADHMAAQYSALFAHLLGIPGNTSAARSDRSATLLAR